MPPLSLIPETSNDAPSRRQTRSQKNVASSSVNAESMNENATIEVHLAHTSSENVVNHARHKVEEVDTNDSSKMQGDIFINEDVDNCENDKASVQDENPCDEATIVHDIDNKHQLRANDTHSTTANDDHDETHLHDSDLDDIIVTTVAHTIEVVDLDHLPLRDLRKMCSEKGLVPHGKKSELIARLRTDT